MRLTNPKRYAVYLLICMYLAAIMADFLAPYAEGTSNRAKFHHPPTQVHWTYDGRLVWPYVYAYEQVGLLSDVYVENPAAGRFPIRLLYRGEPYRLLGVLPATVRLFGVDEPAVVYLLGADQLGRDVLSRLLHGARKSLFIGLAGVLLGTAIGLFYGGFSGYYGGRLDHHMMRCAEIVQCVPSYYVLIALGAALPVTMPSGGRCLLIVCMLGAISWAGMARVIRGMVLSIRQTSYVEAALAMGAPPARIIARHILPNTVSYITIHMTLQIHVYIVGESALSFLGLGVHEPDASWGNMLNEALDLTVLSQYPWMLAPGAAIGLAVLGWNTVGEMLRETFDPRRVGR